jgi:hypothetical protein
MINQKELDKNPNWLHLMHHFTDIPNVMKNFIPTDNKKEFEELIREQIAIALEWASKTRSIEDCVFIARNFVDVNNIILHGFINEEEKKKNAKEILQSIWETKLLQLLSNASSLWSEVIEDFIKKKGINI